MRRYLPVSRVAHHRALAVVDLAFFAGRGRDDDARLRRRRAAQRHDEAADARVPRGEAVVVDQVLPDRHRRCGRGRAPRRSARDTARTRSRSARGPGADGAESVDTSALEMAGFAPRSVDTSSEMALADQGGIESLSMRKLAQALGVVPMALYKHVANKDELLDGMVDVVVGEIDPPRRRRRLEERDAASGSSRLGERAPPSLGIPRHRVAHDPHAGRTRPTWTR